ncbi:MAG: hypothetical protein ACKOGK_06475 [Betaproteobacteria bacterium]|jgi:hypothetical protein
MRRILVDTEWTATPWSEHRDLLWIGLADSAGATFCGFNSDYQVHPSYAQYTEALLAIVTPDVPKLSRTVLASQVRQFCGESVEFWAWIPTLTSFSAWAKLGPEAASVYERCRDIDIQMLRSLIDPWPSGWTTSVQDLNAAATTAGVTPPERAKNHLHPLVHAQWNQKLFGLIEAAKGQR